MIKPSEIVTALITQLRLIPDLVTAMGGDATKIYSYSDQFPARSSIQLAIHQMAVPAIMAAWMGTQPGNDGAMSVWQHKVTLFVRAGDVADAYATIFRLLTKSVPTGFAQPLTYQPILASLDPMDIPYIQRQTDAEGLDYFEIPLSFTELGDQ